MVSEVIIKNEFIVLMITVLILIVVEYGLGVFKGRRISGKKLYVLILIVVEYGLGENIYYIKLPENVYVLILIVVEYGLGGLADTARQKTAKCSLNPYCSGIWSRSSRRKAEAYQLDFVLILIVVEYGLGDII